MQIHNFFLETMSTKVKRFKELNGIMLTIKEVSLKTYNWDPLC